MNDRPLPPPPSRSALEESLYHRRRTLEALFYVYHRNHQELTEVIATALQLSNHCTLWDFFNQGEMIRTIDEVTRLLHNFGAAAATWVEISRRLIRQEYGKSDFWPEYNDEVRARFHANGLALFIKGLRNFAFHRELPLAGAHLSMRQSPNYEAMVARHGPGFYVTMDSNFVLYRDKLLEWSDWNAGAKAFILSAGDKIIVADVVNQHYDEFYAFYQWLDQRLCDLAAQLDFGPSESSRWGTVDFVCRHRALVAGSAARVFACRLSHPKCENANGQLFSQALRH